MTVLIGTFGTVRAPVGGGSVVGQGGPVWPPDASLTPMCQPCRWAEEVTDMVSASSAASRSGAYPSMPGGPPTRVLVELEAEEALALLTAAPFGRVVFTLRALPAIRPVNHIVDEGLIIIRTRLVTRLAAAVTDQLPYPMVVAYQADELDPVARTGWSVVATGVARPVVDAGRVARYERLLQPWVSQVMDSVFAIEPEIIVGFRLEDAGRGHQ